MKVPVQIRVLSGNDPKIISSAFQRAGILKSEAQYQRYFSEQSAGARNCLLATIETEFAGYLTVNWSPAYVVFAESGIPEIEDLNVLPAFRRRGIATLLLDQAEREILVRSTVAGISVGLYPGYNQAQRLYVSRGYIPAGHGVTYRNEYVKEGMQVRLDDDLLLHFTKNLVLHSCLHSNSLKGNHA
jgi:GNAT superfamily N-acetyltransferase